MEHQIDDTVLVNKKTNKKRFRASIFSAWNNTCAYCGNHATTIDHIKAKARGGPTTLSNCVPACLRCNADKSQTSLWIWWIQQPHWSLVRALRVIRWINRNDFLSCVRCTAVLAISHLSIAPQRS